MMNFHDSQVLGEVSNLIEDIEKVRNHTYLFITPDLEQAIRNLEREALHAIVNHIQSHMRRGDGPMIKEADPELERLLAEEEEIERQTRARQNQNPWGE